MTARGVAAVPGPRLGEVDTATWPALAWESEQGAYAAGYEQAKADAGRVVPFEETKRLAGIFFDAGWRDGQRAMVEVLREGQEAIAAGREPELRPLPEPGTPPATTHQCPTCGGDGS